VKLIQLTALVLVVAGSSAAACGSSDKQVAARDAGGEGGEGGGDQPRGGNSTSSPEAGGGSIEQAGAGGTTSEGGSGGKGEQAGAGGDSAQGGAALGGARAAEGGASSAGGEAGASGGEASLPLFDPIDDGTVTLAHSAHCAPGMAFDASGTPFVLHTALSDVVGPGVRVSRLVGRAWAAVGGIVNDADHQIDVNVCPALVVTRTGGIYVAFLQRTIPGSATRARVRRFDGNAWVDAGATDVDILDLDLVPDQNGVPVFVTAELASDHVLTVRRLVGQSFELQTTTNAPPARTVRAAVRPDGTLVLLYAKAVGGFGKALDVATLSGDLYANLGTLDSIPDTSQALQAGDIDVDATRIWASWQKRTSLNDPALVHTHRREGVAWTPLATTEGAQPTLAPNGTGFEQIYNRDVAIIEGRRHDGTNFSSPSPIPLPARYSRLVTHAGVTYLAYTEGPAIAHVVRLNLP
jgi:hypothetical protein